MLFSQILSRFSQVTEEPDGGYLALCPAHGDSRPSLRIWRGDDHKVRITCRAGCPTEDVIAAVGLTFPNLFDAGGEGLTVSSTRPQLVGPAQVAALARYVDESSHRLQTRDDEAAARAAQYAAGRFGIDLEDAKEHGLGVDDGQSNTAFAYRSRSFCAFPRLTVPLKDFSGVARGLQGRDLTGQCPGRWLSLMNPEGARWTAYGVFRGGGGYGVTIVTEGPGDALTAVAVGYDAVAVRGASLAGNPDLIKELADGLRGSQVIVAGDHDEAGAGFTQRLTEGLAAHGVDVFALDIPAEGYDLTRWREDDASAFPMALHRAVKAARPIHPMGSALVDGETGALVPDSDEAARAVRLMTEFAERYGSSDVLNAHALVAFTRGTIKHAPGLGFYLWNGKVWERSDTRIRQAIHYMGAALTVAAAELSAQHAEAGGDPKDDPGSGLKKVALGFTLTRHIDSLIRELRAVPSVHVDASAFDAHPHLLTFANGTVDLRSGELKPHDKGNMLTYGLDIDYRPEAECPRWLSFLLEVFPDTPELADYFRRLVGYGITGSVQEQCFVVLWGKGANGKSVATDTLTNVFRSITKTTAFSTFEEKASGGIPNDIAALRGSRLVMASEGESGKPMSEAILKRASGKDMMTARFMRQEFFEFKPSFLIVLSTNHKPRFRGQDEGLWRRVRMIPFTRWFAPHERDPYLDQKLTAEAEGIAAWAVRGAMEWYASGLQDPPVIADATREYRETSDALAGFFPGVLERCDDGQQLSGGDAFTAYLDWCEAENLPLKERWTRRAFFGAMEERGVVRKKTNKGVALVGVRPAGDAPAPAGPGIFAG
ncbi:toprim domain-containing protein [Streptomyces sp. TRM66268-LWL]|uniref:Toprim domain-containing protein n=1 Tax=Streptomyces polyasparticus TaxID=2767826 RepID=A0ABR7SIJ1_9ACTN|nr:phage/plasmid primase, P4 family [Streptomyces polyasparticus]MBC9714520.1 toprim domain-containing protein [Streptomyces polyasparticus]